MYSSLLLWCVRFIKVKMQYRWWPQAALSLFLFCLFIFNIQFCFSLMSLSLLEHETAPAAFLGCTGSPSQHIHMVCHKICFVSKHSVEEKPGDGLLEEEGWTELQTGITRSTYMYQSDKDKKKATTCKTISFLGASCFTSSEPVLPFICIKEGDMASKGSIYMKTAICLVILCSRSLIFI